MTDWLYHVLTDFTDSLTHWLTDSLAHWLTDSLTHWLTDSLTHWLTDSLTHWLTDWLTDWLMCASCGLSSPKSILYMARLFPTRDTTTKPKWNSILVKGAHKKKKFQTLVYEIGLGFEFLQLAYSYLTRSLICTYVIIHIIYFFFQNIWNFEPHAY